MAYILILIVGIIVGWNLPQPAYAKKMQYVIVSYAKKLQDVVASKLK